MKTAFSFLTPRTAGSAKLFVFGATIGPIVDSFHNQCLLQYHVAPVTIPWPESAQQLKDVFDQEYMLCSSWTVPLLLGFAYVVLGDFLPRLFMWPLASTMPQSQTPPSLPYKDSGRLREKALAAVLSTCLIIKASQYLEMHEPLSSAVPFLPFAETSAEANNHMLMLAALCQWFLLDGTIPALLAAAVTSVGGPLSELPFVATGIWEYLEQAADYFPLANVNDNLGLFKTILGEDYQRLALSSITGPCYFAVTMDAIALGRWFQQSSEDEQYAP